jgi:ferredoxin
MDMTNSLKPENETLTVRVSQQRCQGHARCAAIAPELFESDGFGCARAIGDGTVSPELNSQARLAKANCPEGAIEIRKHGDVSA